MTDFRACFILVLINADDTFDEPLLQWTKHPTFHFGLACGSVRAVRWRLDQMLVERGLCESREKAKRAIMAGRGRANGQVATKASDSIKDSDALELSAGEKFVSRGGYKLEHALEHFHLNVEGMTAIDL